MPSRPEDKIVIRTDEVTTDDAQEGTPAGSSNIIRISPEEVAAAKTPAAANAAPVQTAAMPWYVWLVLSFIPLLNAFVWWQHAPADANRRVIYRGVAVLLAYCSLMFLAGCVLLALWPRRTWLERAASSADRSVVRIENQQSLGAGFVISSYGAKKLILTNRHVVGSTPRCRVLLRSGRDAGGVVVGVPFNADVDLALVLVDSPELTPLGRIGSFENVKTGEEVVAIGHPLGLDYTLTTGIISAKRGGLELQSSAPISPGNSGGPLISKSGYIVGVNTRTIAPASGTSLGFATRADYVLDRVKWNYSRDIGMLLDRIPR